MRLSCNLSLQFADRTVLDRPAAAHAAGYDGAVGLEYAAYDRETARSG